MAILKVDELMAEQIEDRTERMARVDGYIAENSGLKPLELEQIADYILREELTDRDRMKVRNTEYPFFSERQFERRRAEEVPLDVADEVGADGRNYKLPKRRKLTRRDEKFIDKHARSKNVDRRNQYNAFKSGKYEFRSVDGGKKEIVYLIKSRKI